MRLVLCAASGALLWLVAAGRTPAIRAPRAPAARLEACARPEPPSARARAAADAPAATAARGRNAVTVEPPPGEPVPGLATEPPAPYDVRLQVLDPEGRPVPGATVDCGGWTEPADAAGFVSLPPLRARYIRRGETRTFTVSAPGWVRIDVDVPCTAADVVPARFRERGVRLAARFVDPSGTPVAGLGVRLTESRFVNDFWLRTDANGRIAIDVPPRACALAIRSDTWMARETELVPAAREQTIIVYRYARLTGVFRPPVPANVSIEASDDARVTTHRNDWLSTFEVRALPGPVTLTWPARGVVLAEYVVAPGERRDGLVLEFP